MANKIGIYVRAHAEMTHAKQNRFIILVLFIMIMLTVHHIYILLSTGNDISNEPFSLLLFMHINILY